MTEAETVANKLSTGEVNVLTLTSQDRLAYIRAIESLNMQLRKIIKNRGHFPSDDAAAKLIYLALRNITAK